MCVCSIYQQHYIDVEGGKVNHHITCLFILPVALYEKTVPGSAYAGYLYKHKIALFWSNFRLC